MSTHTTAMGAFPARESVVRRLFEEAAQLDRFGMALMRLGLVVVLCWIGGLKFADYEAEGIVPLVANSPLKLLLSFRAGLSPVREQGR